MSDIYKRFAMVIADLHRLEVLNNDPMRYAKRTCQQAAYEALDEGINRAVKMLDLIRAIDLDVKDMKKETQQ